MAKRNIGIDVQPPKGTPRPGDDLDPFTGTLSVRGQVIDGVIISTKMDRSVVVKREYLYYLQKFERYEKRTSKYTAHLPGSIGEVKPGYRVKIAECRPISKTKAFVVIEAKPGELEVRGQEAVEPAAATAGAEAAPKTAAGKSAAKPDTTARSPPGAPKPAKAPVKGGA